jgi:hypothetical protein
MRLAVSLALLLASTSCNGIVGIGSLDGGRAGDGATASPGCSNGIKDGAETDKDCGGGQCPACTGGQACVADSDCDSGSC